MLAAMLLILATGAHGQGPGLGNCGKAQREASQHQEQPMANIETFAFVPPDCDPRILSLLREPVPKDVIVRFYYMAASKSPRANYRWDLHSNGQLFVARHSGTNLTMENTFDRPLPKTPTKRVTQDDIRSLYDQLERADFFNQPGLQRPAPTEGGAYVVVRVRRSDQVHDVVYENIESPLIQYLYAVTG